MPKKLENMSEDELAEETQTADEAMQELRDRKAEIQAERDRRALEAKFGTLTDSDKEALAQMLSVEGIETEEDAGEPGGN